MDNLHYPGGELDLFAAAHNWKDYWVNALRTYIHGSVLEVGAGIGSNTVRLRHDPRTRWVCLEPDERLVRTLQTQLKENPASAGCEVVHGILDTLPPADRFDSILYIDVLEHIPDDAREATAASRRLNPGGHLIVLSPAHPWLFSAFDRAIGHCRRYTRRSLTQLTPTGLRLKRCFYLDAVGMLASAANRLLLRQALPTVQQLAVWDRYMVPCSKLFDPVTGYRLGKSIVGIWERPLFS